MKKTLSLALTLGTLVAFAGCNQAQSEADRLQQEAQSRINDANRQAQELQQQGEQMMNDAQEKMQQAQDAADAVQKLAE